jgi:hypothetical protein
MAITATINYDETITFEWDENDPVDSVLNTWTEQDFIDSILNFCKETIGEEEYDKTLERSSVTLEDDTCAETGEEPKVEIHWKLSHVHGK